MIAVQDFDPADAEAWDAFCGDSVQGTLLHTRRYLSYHGKRFRDRSLVVRREGDWAAVFPAAENPDDPGCIVSHPGITYGGLVHRGDARGEHAIEILRSVLAHYAAAGARRLLYKAVPAIYHRRPASDDTYALTHLGARLVRRDLSCAINLADAYPLGSRRRRGVRRAQSAGLRIERGPDHLAAFWRVLSENLAERHGVRPVHDLAEISLLAERFPEAIRCIVATDGADVVAGTLLYDTPTVSHAQYIASSPRGFEASALDAVFADAIALARQSGRRYFDFGISTEQGGTILNAGLYQFKSEFGGGGIVHDYYQIDLGVTAHELR